MKFDNVTYFDKELIDSIVKQEKIVRYIIFQTTLKNDSLNIIDKYSDDHTSYIASFLFWPFNDSLFIKLITKDSIFRTQYRGIPRPFNYRFINKLGADESENKLLVVPPLLEPLGSEVVIFKSSEKNFFYELGDVGLYIEDVKKINIRKEFIDLLKQEIMGYLEKRMPEKVYYRPPLFP
jgi:hypothetical protein